MDIKCVVCGEPWDAYGVTHGDMEPWQAALFRVGAGCPSCEGVDNGWTPTTFSDVENGDDDPMIRIVLAETKAERPAWREPDPIVEWTCACCGVDVGTDANGDVYVGQRNATQYRSMLDMDREDDYSPHIVAGHQICVSCVESCAECGVETCNALSGDPYDGLASAPHPDHWNRCVCVDCLETLESERPGDEWIHSHAPDLRRTLDNALWKQGEPIDADDLCRIFDLDLESDDVQAYCDDGADRDRMSRLVASLITLWRQRPCDPRAARRYMERTRREIKEALNR
jgi:hypothetical protein